MLAIIAAAIAGFVLSATYYGLLPVTPADERVASSPPPPVLAAVELSRSAAVAGMIAVLMSAGDWTTPGHGAVLGAGLWTLPVVLLVGSIVHESTPYRSAMLHAGDWLIKLVALGAIIGWLN